MLKLCFFFKILFTLAYVTLQSQYITQITMPALTRQDQKAACLCITRVHLPLTKWYFTLPTYNAQYY